MTLETFNFIMKTELVTGRWLFLDEHVLCLCFVDHIAEEQRDQESSLVNRDVSDTPSTTIHNGTLQEAARPGINNNLHSMS